MPGTPRPDYVYTKRQRIAELARNCRVRPVDTVPLREPSGRSEASREQPSGIFTGARRPDLLGVARRSEIIVAQVTR